MELLRAAFAPPRPVEFVFRRLKVGMADARYGATTNSAVRQFDQRDHLDEEYDCTLRGMAKASASN